MKFVIFGLTVSSSWGNGHATLWRGLCRALDRQGHYVVFFERDVPYYAKHRDLHELPGDGDLHLFSDWEEIRPTAQEHLSDADVGMVTSFCHDGVAATELIASSPVPLSAFYDLDTPVTLDHVQSGKPVDYIGPRGLRDFDLVLSFAGGKALDELKEHLGARRVVPLYGSVDPDMHRPVDPKPRFRADLSYLGTYAEDRQETLGSLFIEPARRLPDRRFLLGGAMYPETFPWTSSIYFVYHIDPSQHPAFYSSSRLTLNVTRQAMKERGYCPPVRLFEASACGTPILTDAWEGIDTFFEPGSEILVARTTEEAVAALEKPSEALDRIGRRARERTLDEHTVAHRARELEAALQEALRPSEKASHPSAEVNPLPEG